MRSQTGWRSSKAGGCELGGRTGEPSKGHWAGRRGKSEGFLRKHGVAVSVVAGGQGVGPGGGGREGVVVYTGRHTGSVVRQAVPFKLSNIFKNHYMF